MLFTPTKKKEGKMCRERDNELSVRKKIKYDGTIDSEDL